MKRLITKYLLEWKNSDSRKPLIIKGARQVGKTYAILEFGKLNYKNTIYINFEGDKERLTNIFIKDLNPKRIIDELAFYSKQTILENDTLIVLDEIQACEQALTSLKYFNETANGYHIIAASSLLELAINRGNYSFPVGKVDMKTMYPLSFEEYLLNTDSILFDKIKNAYNTFTPLSSFCHEEAIRAYHTYLVIGGYPAVINAYLEKKDFNIVKSVQASISDAYIADMAKYATPTETVRSIEVFNSLPSQLAKENTKFQYSIIKSKARSKDYETSLAWLKKANVVLQITKVTEGKYPLNFYEQIDVFKAYYSDVGLLCYKSGISSSDILIDSTLSDKYRGILAENYVAQELLCNGHTLHYWESGNTAEIDFVIQLDSSSIPVEVKSSDNVRARSLGVFISKYSPKYSIRLSTKNFGFENNIKSIPLYALFCIKANNN
jgi:predicted AAA+ superfamily ATPase